MIILVIDIFKDLSYVWKHWTEIVLLCIKNVLRTEWLIFVCVCVRAHVCVQHIKENDVNTTHTNEELVKTSQGNLRVVCASSSWNKVKCQLDATR